MSPGIAIFVGIVGTFAVIAGLGRLLAHRARAMEGQAVPELPGALGKAIRGSTVLWFHSPTCGPCRAMEGSIATLEQAGSAHRIDVSQDLDVARAFGVMATPTTIKIVDGRIQSVRTGVLGPAQLAAL